MNTIIVACRTISDELKLAVSETDCNYPILWIDSGLHMDPASLKAELQKGLNNIDNVDLVLLAFGYCGNALLGITPPSFKLILPKVDDCITLLLGSKERRSEISAEMGTYFLTKGWLDYEKNIWAEYQEAIKRHGQVRAERIYSKILEHYKRLGVIDTGAYELGCFVEKTKNIAKDLKLQHHVLSGDMSYLKKLLTGPWDEDFISIASGETIVMAHIYG